MTALCADGGVLAVKLDDPGRVMFPTDWVPTIGGDALPCVTLPVSDTPTVFVGEPAPETATPPGVVGTTAKAALDEPDTEMAPVIVYPSAAVREPAVVTAAAPPIGTPLIRKAAIKRLRVHSAMTN